jgi:hypothetical protein
VEFVSQTDFFAFALLVIAFLTYAIFGLLARRGSFRPNLRRLSAYDALAGQVGEAVESGGRVHVSLAGNSIVDEGTATSVAGLDLLGEVSTRSTISDRSTLGTTADPTTLPLIGDTIRHAAERIDAPYDYEALAARLVALDPLSMAAGVTSLVVDEGVTSNVLIGSFEREAVLITEAGARRGLSQTVASDRLEGQAVGLAAGDYALLGEELYVAGAYLSDKPSRLGSLGAQDILRWIVFIGIIVGVILRSLGR